uniref:Uncharacterized protein n=1 Tax=Ditylenchus dipsaci TaxID=166011 RepID=A0A915DCL5_9BILA
MASLFFLALAFLCLFAYSGAQICGEVKIAAKGIITKDFSLGYCQALQHKAADEAMAEAQEFLNEYAKSQGLDILKLPSGVHGLDTPAAGANKSSTVNRLVKFENRGNGRKLNMTDDEITKKLAEVMSEMGKNFVAENKLAVSQHPILLMTPHVLAPNTTAVNNRVLPVAAPVFVAMVTIYTVGAVVYTICLVFCW